MKRNTLCLLCLLLLPCVADAQAVEQRIRIMTWNVLQLSAESAGARLSDFRRVLEQTQPHILVTQENVDSYNETMFMTALPGWPDRNWNFVYDSGPDTNPACYFDTDKVHYLGTRYIATELRNIAEYHFVVKGTRDTFRVFTCHLKAGDGIEYNLQRLREAIVIVRRMDTIVREARRTGSGDTLFVLAGDLNVYTSDELAYRAVTTPSPAIPDEPFLYDPIARPGNWSANPNFADVHTQSSRVRQFGGGTVGGMNHRFDQILVNAAMIDHYAVGSYTAYGNDGQHLNDSINRLPNLAVPDSIAEALHAASDHLPVFADFIFASLSGSVREAPSPQISIVSIRPQPASDHITLRVQSPAVGSLDVRLVDARGETVLRKRGVMIIEGEQTIELDVRSLPSGVYGYSVTTATGKASGKIAVVK